MVSTWPETEARLLEQVFHQHAPDQARASDDLVADRMIDSLSVVAALEVLVECTDNDAALEVATPSDFTSLARIASLHAQLTARQAP